MATFRDLLAAAKSEITEVDTEGAAAAISDGAIVLDVREPDEFDAGRVPGALSCPRGFLEVRADLEHPKRDPWLADRGRKLVLYCGGGHRSALAARTLLEMGFTRVVSLRGGWTGWVEAQHPVER